MTIRESRSRPPAAIADTASSRRRPTPTSSPWVERACARRRGVVAGRRASGMTTPELKSQGLEAGAAWNQSPPGRRTAAARTGRPTTCLPSPIRTPRSRHTTATKRDLRGCCSVAPARRRRSSPRRWRWQTLTRDHSMAPRASTWRLPTKSGASTTSCPDPMETVAITSAKRGPATMGPADWVACTAPRKCRRRRLSPRVQARSRRPK